MKKDHKEFLKRINKFVENILDLVKKLPKNIINVPIIKQLIDAGTSVGANYHEACEAESSKDFVHKIRITIKELKETKYWLRLLYIHNKVFNKEIALIGKESNELLKIFSTICKKFKK